MPTLALERTIKIAANSASFRLVSPVTLLVRVVVGESDSDKQNPLLHAQVQEAWNAQCKLAQASVDGLVATADREFAPQVKRIKVAAEAGDDAVMKTCLDWATARRAKLNAAINIKLANWYGETEAVILSVSNKFGDVNQEAAKIRVIRAAKVIKDIVSLTKKLLEVTINPTKIIGILKTCKSLFDDVKRIATSLETKAMEAGKIGAKALEKVYGLTDAVQKAASGTAKDKVKSVVKKLLAKANAPLDPVRAALKDWGDELKLVKSSQKTLANVIGQCLKCEAISEETRVQLVALLDKNDSLNIRFDESQKVHDHMSGIVKAMNNDLVASGLKNAESDTVKGKMKEFMGKHKPAFLSSEKKVQAAKKKLMATVKQVDDCLSVADNQAAVDAKKLDVVIQLSKKLG